MTEQEIVTLPEGDLVPYYEPLRAFALAMACVAWAYYIQFEEKQIDKYIPIGLRWRASRRVRCEYAKWALIFLWPDGYRIVPR